MVELVDTRDLKSLGQ